MSDDPKSSIEPTVRSRARGESPAAGAGAWALVPAAATVAFLVPAYFALRHPGELALNTSMVMGLSAGLFTGIAATLWLGCRALMAFAGSAIADGFARFCFAWALLTGFVSPLIRSGGMVDAHAMPNHLPNAFFSLALSLVFAWMPFPAGGKVFLSAAAVAPLVLLWAVMGSTTGQGGTFGGIARLGLLSAQDNMIVLSLDGIPGHLVQELIETRDPLIEDFKDFTWFADVVSTSPATTASMFSELFGNRDFRSIASTESDLTSRLDWGAVWFNGTGDDVLLYGPGGYSAANPERHVKLSRRSASSSSFLATVSFLNIAVARSGSNRSARLVHSLSERLDRSLGPNAVYRGPSWKEPFLGDRDVLDSLTSSLRVGDAGRSIRIMHFVHTHFPPDFDEHGVLRATEPEWQEKNKNPAALLDQTRFALSQVSRFLDALRKLGIYDRSLVVVKSDHGEPPEYFDAAPWNLRVRNNPHWGYCRYRPLLMMKDRDASAPALTADRRFVTLGDLAKTLCTARAHPGRGCEQFPGLDLLSGAQVSEDERWVYVEVVKNSGSGFKFDDHETVRFDRSRGFLEQFYDMGLISDEGGPDTKPSEREPRR